MRLRLMLLRSRLALPMCWAVRNRADPADVAVGAVDRHPLGIGDAGDELLVHVGAIEFGPRDRAAQKVGRPEM